MYIEGDVPYVSNNNGYGNGLGFGGGWEGLIGLIIAASLFNGNGFGFGGGRGGYGGDFAGWQMGRLATTNDVASGFSTSEIMSDLNSIILGQATMQNFINQGFAGLNATINSGFAGVNNSICTLGYQNAQLVNGLSRELADCCCKTQSSIADVKYANERQTCDIIAAINAGNQRLVDIYTNDKIETLNRKLASAESEALTYKNNAYLISQIKEPCPIPAYITPNPNCCYNPFGFGYGYGANYNAAPCGTSVL